MSFGIQNVRRPRCGFEFLESRRMLTSIDPIAAYQSFVNAAYDDALGRPAEAAALDFWVQSPELDAIRLPLAEALVHSDEYFANLVRHDYEQALGRAPDAAGLAYWTAALRAGLNDDRFAAELLASPEFYAKAGGDDRDWIQALFETALGRAPDAAGADYWNSQLAAGAGRFDVAFAFAAGTEQAQQQVADDFERYLDSAPDEQTAAYFAEQLASGLTNEELVAHLIGGSDYFKLRAGVAPTVVPVPSLADQAFDPQINARVQQGDADVLFLGDSITWGWQNTGQTTWQQYFGARNAVNAGVPGDTTENALWRLENGNWDGIHPKLAIVELGTNNLGVDSSPDIAAGIAAIVAALRQKLPDAKILVLGIFPRGLTPGEPLRLEEQQANQAISQLADDQTIFYLDLSPAFLHADGALYANFFFPDFVHPNATGYQAWAAAMEYFVDELLKS